MRLMIRKGKNVKNTPAQYPHNTLPTNARPRTNAPEEKRERRIVYRTRRVFETSTRKKVPFSTVRYNMPGEFWP